MYVFVDLTTACANPISIPRCAILDTVDDRFVEAPDGGHVFTSEEAMRSLGDAALRLVPAEFFFEEGIARELLEGLTGMTDPNPSDPGRKLFQGMDPLAESAAEASDEDIVGDVGDQSDADRDRVRAILLNATQDARPGPLEAWGSALPPDLWREDADPHRSRAEAIVYCGFDGVLNRQGTPLLPVSWCHPMRKKDGPHQGLEPDLVARVDALLEEMRAALVLSTSWIHAYGMNGCLALLRHFGLQGEVLGVTPRKMSCYSRALEIEWDFRERTPKRWVILNDPRNTDVGRSTRRVIRDHLVLTDPILGVTDADVERARTLLRHP